LPWRKGELWGVRAGSRWPHIKTAQEKGYLPFPFFLAYAGSLLAKKGFEVKLIDSLAQELSVGAFLKIVSRENPDLLVAETSTPSLWNDLSILKKLPRDLSVALCGPEANIRDLEFLSKHKFIHYVFIGEYEFTLLELAQRLEAKKSLSDLRSLIYRDNEHFKANPVRPLLEDLDELPWPLREGLPMEKYNDTPGGIPSPSVQMWSSRGCPYQCLFCIWPQLMYHKNRYRIRNIIKVVDEMEYLVRKKGFKSIYFDDDTTNIGKLRMIEFAEEIKRRNLNVPWAMMARADLMEEDILEKLRSAGLFAVKYGVESSNQELLDRICKNMDLRKTERMIRFTQSLGIKTHLTFCFGLPGETQETIQKTIDFAKDLNPDSLQFSIATAFPGTSFFQTLEREGHITSRNFFDYDGNFKSMLCTDSLSSQELQKAKRRADKTWQKHVWKTRYQHLQPMEYLQKLKDNARNFGLYFALSKSFSFLRSKIVFKHPRLSFKIPKVFSFRWNLSWVDLYKTLKNKVVFKHPRLSFKIPRVFSFRWNLSWGNLYRTLRDKTEQAKRYYLQIKKHYLNILGIYNGSYAFKGPDCVQIDLTSNCNNNCISCWCNSPLLGDKAYQGSKKYKTLPTQLVKAVIDELVGMGTSELYFSGGGEPFMHPDILSEVEHAKSRGLHCCINTNFTLVADVTVKRLIELSVDALTVSVWAAMPKTYVLTHPNKDEATFYRIKDTLKMLNSLKNKGRPFVKIYNVISNLNCHEIEQMVEFAEETGSEAVEFTVVDTIPGATDKLMLNREQRLEVLAKCEQILKRNNKVQVLNMEHFMRRLSDSCADQAQYDSGVLGKTPCYVGWVFSRIMPDGDVNFCLKAHRIPVGNLYKNSFREIWNSKKQREFREKALKFDKNNSFFHFIGNDENCKVGCYKSCDDIGRNMCVQRRLDQLSPVQKAIFRFISTKINRNRSF
jgi:radical SAM superfamily enzyme YgiQ (UPF0313 family)/MoaA/NifB/PqqE/SkfB family radical SAM enzyme